MATPTIHVVIKDKNGVVADDYVTAISSYNEVGLFDVLPMHTNFISLIKTKLILHKLDQPDKEIKVGTGLLQVVGGEIHVYLGLPEAMPEQDGKLINTLKPQALNANEKPPALVATPAAPTSNPA